jgi:FAD/FMN-containing dehydrogenase
LTQGPPGFRGRWLAGGKQARHLANRISGPFEAEPQGWAEPEGLDDLARLLAWAHREGVCLIPRGGGTGMPAGNLGPAVILSTTHAFQDLGPVEPDEALCGARLRVGAGVTMAQVEAHAAARGFHLPPLPSSARWATVGGMVANNGAGAASFLHGAMDRWVVEVEGFLANGQPVTLGPGTDLQSLGIPLDPDDPAWSDARAHWPRVSKNSSGYGLDRWLASGNAAGLATGSEGTLLVITAVTLRLTQARPHQGLFLWPLDDLRLLPEVAVAARGLGAETCEMLGRRILDLAQLDDDPNLAPWSRHAEALVLVGFSATREEGWADDRLGSMARLAASSGRPGLATRNPARMAELWGLRHRASPLIAARAAAGFYSTQFIEDNVVPVHALPTYLEALEQIMEVEGEGMDAVIFGHAGDGNLHVNPWINPQEPGWQDRLLRVLEAVVATVSELGGTLAGEHGDGRLRAPFLRAIWGDETCRAFARVKGAFDPTGILNPGTILPLSGQSPIEGLAPGPRTWPLSQRTTS